MATKRKRKSKLNFQHTTWKALTICLAVVTSLITARTTYLISPLPFDEFRVWRETQMGYLFAAFLFLLLANIVLPGYAIHKQKFKAAALLSGLCCVIPLIWLVAVMSLSVS